MLSCPKCGAAVQPGGGPSVQCPSCRNYFPVNGQPSHLAAPYESDHGAPGPVIVVHHGTSSGTSFWSMYWMLRVGVFVVVGLCGSGGWAWRHFSGMGIDSESWNGKEPLDCDGNDQIEVSGVKATFTSGAAIVASGNCHLTCKDCILKAPVAVRASANAEVILLNGAIEGTDSALTASDNSKIDVRGNATVVGTTKQTSNAKITGVVATSAPVVSSAPATSHPVVAVAAPKVPAPHAAPHAPALKKK